MLLVEQVDEQTVHLPVIWDAMMLIWYNCNAANLYSIKYSYVFSWLYFVMIILFTSESGWSIYHILQGCFTDTAKTYGSFCVGEATLNYVGKADCYQTTAKLSLKWRHNGHDGISNPQPHHWLLNRLFRHRSKKTSKLPVAGLHAGNWLVTGEIPAQMASNAENVSIWVRHHVWLFSGCTVANGCPCSLLITIVNSLHGKWCDVCLKENNEVLNCLCSLENVFFVLIDPELWINEANKHLVPITIQSQSIQLWGFPL